MSFALGLVLAAAQFGQGAGFADLDAVDPIRQEVNRLADDPRRTSAHYTLKQVS